MSALALRVLACVTMLLDHIGLSFGIHTLRLVGRISFPIFVFLIYNGYRHTHHRLQYGLRLGLFALLSQVPFGLFCKNTLWYQSGNVMISLLIAYLCVWATDALRQNKKSRFFWPLPLLFVFFLYFFGLIRSDYGFKGPLMAVVFLLFWEKGLWGRLLTAAGVAAACFWPFVRSLAVWLLRGAVTPQPTLSLWEQEQIFGVLALIPLCLYNGKKGRVKGKVIQYGFYAFYPAHMLLLWAIRAFLT